MSSNSDLNGMRIGLNSEVEPNSLLDQKEPVPGTSKEDDNSKDSHVKAKQSVSDGKKEDGLLLVFKLAHEFLFKQFNSEEMRIKRLREITRINRNLGKQTQSQPSTSKGTEVKKNKKTSSFQSNEIFTENTSTQNLLLTECLGELSVLEKKLSNRSRNKRNTTELQNEQRVPSYSSLKKVLKKLNLGEEKIDTKKLGLGSSTEKLPSQRNLTRTSNQGNKAKILNEKLDVKEKKCHPVKKRSKKRQASRKEKKTKTA